VIRTNGVDFGGNADQDPDPRFPHPDQYLDSHIFIV